MRLFQCKLLNPFLNNLISRLRRQLPLPGEAYQTNRTAAVKGFTAAGFQRIRKGGGTCDLKITKENFEKTK
ncbi:MAG: hypothetical protein J6B86_06150 [Clostridia bacterium]|nr:hypothetical protein [Clostridia bacterium]